MKPYQPGKMGMAEGMAIVLGIAMARLLLSPVANLVNETAQLAWLSLIFFNVIPVLAFFMMTYVTETVSKSLFTACKQLLGSPGAWLIFAFYSLMFFGNGIILLRQYSEYTLFTALPRIELKVVIIWYALIVAIICCMGLETIARSGYVLLPLLAGGLIIVFVLLYPFYIIHYLSPWQGNGILHALQFGVTNAGYDMWVLSLVFLAASFQTPGTLKRAVLYSMSGGLALKLWFVFTYLMVFGISVGSEKTLPFYEMAKLVYLNQYFQRIEALLIVVWVFWGVLAIAGSIYVGLYLFGTLLNLPALRPMVPLVMVICANLAILPPDIPYVLKIDQFLTYAAGLGVYGFPTVLFILAYLSKRRKPLCAASGQ